MQWRETFRVYVTVSLSRPSAIWQGWSMQLLEGRFMISGVAACCRPRTYAPRSNFNRHFSFNFWQPKMPQDTNNTVSVLLPVGFLPVLLWQSNSIAESPSCWSSQPELPAAVSWLCDREVKQPEMRLNEKCLLAIFCDLWSPCIHFPLKVTVYYSPKMATLYMCITAKITSKCRCHFPFLTNQRLMMECNSCNRSLPTASQWHTHLVKSLCEVTFSTLTI